MFFWKQLKDAILGEDFYTTNEILEKIISEDDAFLYVSRVLDLMEENAELDYGVPGPIVHFVEKFYKNGYEELLLKSVQKCPTSQTIWMVNRIINDPTLDNKAQYMQVLLEISQREDVSEKVKNEAKDFFNYQKGVIDFNNGTIKIANDFIIYPNYTFKEFKESKFYKNQEAIRVIYLEGIHNLNNNNYMVSLFFRDEKIYMLSLICCDKQYCEENEKNRKELHDEILKQFDIVEKREFSWGVVASNYDARSNCSSIDFCYY